ncbi:hypothetical protein C4572_03045 [Candidatus Parcubacteria bacterium]|nr:MAG: hypothetical protein C4572_03045 [Candidatus Parcubacteria bacterium]
MEFKNTKKRNRAFAYMVILLVAGALGALGTGTVYLSRILPEEREKFPTIEQQIILRVGQEKEVLGLIVSPTKVVSDSRCPKGKVCIWAGTVSVETVITVGDKTETITLQSAGGPQRFENYEISLVKVFPEKGELPVETSQYLLTFLVVKK